MPDEDRPQSNLELLASELTEGSLSRRLVEAAVDDDEATTLESVLRDRMNEIRDELQNPQD